MQFLEARSFRNSFYVIVLSLVIPGFGIGQVDVLYNTWVEAVNSNSITTSYGSHYDSSTFVAYGRVIESGSDAISLQIKKLTAQTGKIKSIELLDLTRGNSGNIMSIAKVNTDKGPFMALTTWQKRGGDYIREFEVILPQKSSGSNDIEPAIGLQRQRWEEFSNAHNPDKLIKELCALDVNYIQGGKQIVGQEELIKAYKYMEGEQWKIKLTKQHLVQVDDKTAFEIGTYVSSGQGQYLLIWRKRYWDGQWVIETDSNF